MRTILSIPICPYHFVRYHFVLEPLRVSVMEKVGIIAIREDKLILNWIMHVFIYMRNCVYIV